MRRGRLVVISGPSGVGKTTVCRELLRLPGLERVVTCTTRPPRPGEVDGKDYHFLSEDEFEQGVRAGAFLEHARVHGHLYGTPRGQVERGLLEGKDMILAIDVQGAAQIRRALGTSKRLPSAKLVTVFLEPPDWKELEQRLVSRGTDKPADVAARLAAAERELRESADYDLKVANVEVERTVREILDHLGYEQGTMPGTGTGGETGAPSGKAG
ncbi:MAG: guanylate kinase [Planctomycetota bacterium]